MQRPSDRPMPAFRVSVTLALSLAISACASRPEPAVEPDPEPEPVIQPIPHIVIPKQTQPEPEPEPQPPKAAPKREQPPGVCAWSKTRGVATLLAVKTEPPRGTWQFFPGDKVVFHGVPDKASPGDEFKALLQTPMSGPCNETRLVLFGPV